MKLNLTLLLICFTLCSSAQIKITDLIGSWKVADIINAKNASAKEKETSAILRPDVMKTTFRFDAAGHGKFHMPMTNISIAEGSKPSEEMYWTFDEKKTVSHYT